MLDDRWWKSVSFVGYLCHRTTLTSLVKPIQKVNLSMPVAGINIDRPIIREPSVDTGSDLGSSLAFEEAGQNDTHLKEQNSCAALQANHNEGR